MLFKKIFEFFLKKSELQEHDIIALSREKIIFSQQISEWVQCNKNSVLLIDKDVLDFLKSNSLDFDYSFCTLIVVWGNWVIIGETYSNDGRYAVIKEFILTSPHHGIVYKNDSHDGPTKLFKLEEDLQ